MKRNGLSPVKNTSPESSAEDCGFSLGGVAEGGCCERQSNKSTSPTISAFANYEILLNTKNQPIIVDQDDYSHLKHSTWEITPGGYARNSDTRQLLHRIIMKAKHGEIVDHINGNKLDNRRNNLRFCNASQNNRNKKKNSIGNTSKYKGVRFHDGVGKYTSEIRIGGKKKHLGVFVNQKAAAFIYDREMRKQLGGRGRFNFV